MKTVCLLIFGVVAGATALVTAYHVDPRTAAMSGKVPGNQEYGGVTQTVTCNFDSLSYVELFAGAKGAGGAYTAQILEDGDPVMTSPGDRVPDHGWVKFYQWNDTVAFTKGKLLTIKFTRGGSDSIQYYFQEGNPYPYGELSTTSPHAGQDLAMRCLGRMNAGSEV